MTPTSVLRLNGINVAGVTLRRALATKRLSTRRNRLSIIAYRSVRTYQVCALLKPSLLALVSSTLLYSSAAPSQFSLTRLSLISTFLLSI